MSDKAEANMGLLPFMGWIVISTFFGIGIGRTSRVAAVPTHIVADPQWIDVATAFPSSRLIIFNPRAATLRPALFGFFMWHEQAHLWLGQPQPSTPAKELQADCQAAKWADSMEVKEALAFFDGVGPFAYDAVHPTGLQRSAEIRRCRP